MNFIGLCIRSCGHIMHLALHALVVSIYNLSGILLHLESQYTLAKNSFTLDITSSSSSVITSKDVTSLQPLSVNNSSFFS